MWTYLFNSFTRQWPWGELLGIVKHQMLAFTVDRHSNIGTYLAIISVIWFKMRCATSELSIGISLVINVAWLCGKYMIFFSRACIHFKRLASYVKFIVQLLVRIILVTFGCDQFITFLIFLWNVIALPPCCAPISRIYCLISNNYIAFSRYLTFTMIFLHTSWLRSQPLAYWTHVFHQPTIRPANWMPTSTLLLTLRVLNRDRNHHSRLWPVSLCPCSSCTWLLTNSWAYKLVLLTYLLLQINRT